MKTAMIGAVAAASLACAAQAQQKDCNKTSIGRTPLSDMGSALYQGFDGGLYANGANVAPPAHLAAGRALGEAVEPLGPDGQPSAQGWNVLVTIGMSNTSQESAQFIPMVEQFANKHPRLRVVNGAQGGQDANKIKNPGSPYWDFVDSKLAGAGLTPAQVQAVWLKQAIAGPSGQFPSDALVLQSALEQIVAIIKQRYPNVKVCYMSSRIYAGYALGNLNPEPYAYQSGFSVKWAIQEQITGKPALNFDPGKGPALAPWLGWAAYLWADGLTPRSDGLIWQCDDLAADGTHPSTKGAQKVGAMLLEAFRRDPTSRPWFVECPADLNDDGALNIDDFLEFQSLFATQHPLADYDGSGGLDIDDFLAFQVAFALGCP